MPTSPMLMNSVITVINAIVVIYCSWSLAMAAKGKVSTDVTKRLSEIQNFLLP